MTELVGDLKKVDMKVWTAVFFLFKKIYGGRRALEAEGVEDGAVEAVVDRASQGAVDRAEVQPAVD